MTSLLTNYRNKVLTLTLNRPDVFNSFNRPMAFALRDALAEAGENADVRCVVITGAGKAFSAGQDLNEAIDPDGPPIETIVSEHYNPLIVQIRSLEKPVVAAVNGVAAGAGANIALACDIVVAKESASFIQAFSKIGLIPDSGGTFFLPRLIGWQRASALAMLGEKVPAREAESMGMIYKAVADEEFDTYVGQLADRLAAMPTRGLALTKLALNQSFFHNLVEQLDTELELQYAASQTADYKEGVQAFLDKRKPQFRGE